MQFYRQKLLGKYIVDFYAPSVKLIIEVDGGQHFEEHHIQKDKERDFFMEKQGLKVLRFDNLQVLRSTNDVVGVIYNALRCYLLKKEGILL
jgi:very-short-patch-repair endonuclease